MSLELPTLRCSQGEALAFEHKLDIFVLRRKQIIDLVKDRSFILSAICLGGSVADAEPQPAAEILADDGPRGYDVICLPVILWNSRFQRPQQLMRTNSPAAATASFTPRWVSAGHSRRACRGNGSGVFEMTLPGAPGVNVYRELPSRKPTWSAWPRPSTGCASSGRLASAVVVVQLPFWTALAERLRERFGWPVVYDCMDDHSGFSTNCESMLRAEDRTIAEADLVVVTADLLETKVRSQRPGEPR